MIRTLAGWLQREWSDCKLVLQWYEALWARAMGEWWVAHTIDRPRVAAARSCGIAHHTRAMQGGGAWDAVRRLASVARMYSQSVSRGLTDITRPRVIQRKPTTPSNRHTALTDKKQLWRGRPHPRLSVGLHRRAGRCAKTGHITVRHRGGGNKRMYRIIDFKRTHWSGIPGIVERVEYDPNRSALIALIRHKKKCKAVPNKVRPDRMAYIICPAGLQLGQEVVADRENAVDVKVGNAMTLRHVPVGTVVHNIELRPGYGAQLCRSAGTSARVLERDDSKGLALLRLQSKEQRLVRLQCMVSIGQVSNPEHKNQSFGKAGRMRWKGIRPTVRGVAMNPIDHPHGGGEGKTSGGRPSVSKWGKPTKGYRTRSKRKKNPHIVKRRFEK